MSGQTDKIVNIEKARDHGGNGGSGNGGDRHLYDLYGKVGNLEGQIKGLATKADMWKALFLGVIAITGAALGLFKLMVQPFFETLFKQPPV